jgi:purine nucleosidase
VRIVLDTDPGIDDALAILYLAAHQQVEIVAVGSVHGNVPAPQAADNALRVLELAGLNTVPVAIGARHPLAQPLHTAEFVHGHDGLGGHAGPPPVGRPIRESAAEQLVRLARRHPGELTLLALGPLTNIAVALLLEPELPHLLRSVIVMGGALTVPGNITPSADANSWHDPEATDLVLGAGLPLTLIGLEVTEAARANQAWLDKLAAIDSPRARFATKIVRHYADFYAAMFGRREATLHDPLAAAIALDPALATYRRLAVAVELTGTHTRGRLIADLRPIVNATHIESPISDRHPVDVALTADADTFLTRLLEALR